MKCFEAETKRAAPASPPQTHANNSLSTVVGCRGRGAHTHNVTWSLPSRHETWSNTKNKRQGRKREERKQEHSNKTKNDKHRNRVRLCVCGDDDMGVGCGGVDGGVKSVRHTTQAKEINLLRDISPLLYSQARKGRNKNWKRHSTTNKHNKSSPSYRVDAPRHQQSHTPLLWRGRAGDDDTAARPPRPPKARLVCVSSCVVFSFPPSLSSLPFGPPRDKTRASQRWAVRGL